MVAEKGSGYLIIEFLCDEIDRFCRALIAGDGPKRGAKDLRVCQAVCNKNTLTFRTPPNLHGLPLSLQGLLGAYKDSRGNVTATPPKKNLHRLLLSKFLCRTPPILQGLLLNKLTFYKNA